MNFWGLPGPAGFADRIEEAIRSGSSVIVRFATAVPAGFESDLRQRLHEFLDWHRLDASSAAGDDPFQFLRRELLPSVGAADMTTVTEMALHEYFLGKLLWVENIDPASWPQWCGLLQSYAVACRSVDLFLRSSFIVVTQVDRIGNSVPEEVTLISIDFRAIVGPLDMFILALHRATVRNLPPEHLALVAQAVTQLAKWDIDLAERLLKCNPEDLMQPRSILRDYANERDWTAETPQCWETGTLDELNGRPTIHSALLEITGNVRDVQHRLWAAQAAVLLPLVEERRTAIISRHGRRLQLPVETESGLIDDPFDLSVGQIVRSLDRRGTPYRIIKRLRHLQRVRNHLAHMKPVSGSDALHRFLLNDD